MADLDSGSVSKLRVVDLREHLSTRGLPTSGLKADLVKRLKEALENEQLGNGGTNNENLDEPINNEEEPMDMPEDGQSESSSVMSSSNEADDKMQLEEQEMMEEGKRMAEEEAEQKEILGLEEEKSITSKEKLILEEEIRKAETKKLRVEESRKAEKLRAEEEIRNAEAEKLRLKEENRKIEAEKLRVEEKNRKAEAEKLRVYEENKKAEAETLRVNEENRKAEAEKLRVEEESRKAKAEMLRVEEQNRKAEVERLRVEEENRQAEAEKLHLEELQKLEAERLRQEENERQRLRELNERLHIEEERRRLECERLRIEEERVKQEAEKLRLEAVKVKEEKLEDEASKKLLEERRKEDRLKAEEEIKVEVERLQIEEEKKREERQKIENEKRKAEKQRAEEMRRAELENLKIEEEKRKAAKERLRDDLEKEEKRFAADTERRMAAEEEMKKEQERWLVAEQMRLAVEKRKKLLQAEEQKRVLKEQQRLMEEEMERQKNVQQLHRQPTLVKQEDQKEQSDTSKNSLQLNPSAFISLPPAINILPPPPAVLISNIPPPPSIVPTSVGANAPGIQVSAPPTRFPPPPPITITATASIPIPQLETEVISEISVDMNDTDESESMDTSENTSVIRLPQALEKVLALKTVRAQQLGIDPDTDVQPVLAVEERAPTPAKSNVVTLVAVDEDEQADQENRNKKDSKSRRRKKKKKKHHSKCEPKNEIRKSESQKSKETSVDIDIEYVQEVIDISDPMYSQFMKIFEKFKLTDGEKEKEEAIANAEKEANKETLNPMAFRKKPVDLDDDDDDEDQDDDKKEDKPKLSKRKLKKLSRMTVAELKQKVNRPELVEMHDVTAKDPVLLLHLKASRNTVPVPRHWCFKRKYLQGKRGIEKPAFELPDFIKRTGIMEMRQALQEKEDQKTMKAKMRERVRPKLGKIDIDYQKLHDAFFKWQTKPRMTIHGDLYYEGKEFETRLKEKKPGDLSEDLRTALGMPTGPNANKCPPPWLIAMQRYGPPPSYPNLKIPGLNAPIPDSCLFGYHAGGWGKPPVDETGRPLYGDVFGTQILDNQPHIQEEEIDHTLWGELESESSEEEEEDEDDEEEEEEEKQEDETGLVTPSVEGLITPSGFSSIPAGMETPDMIELRKRKIEAEKEGGETPALYTILPEKKTERVGAAMMGSTHIYDLAAAIPASKLKIGGTSSVPPHGIEVALDPSELEMDSAAMAARYEQTMREQQSQLEKEDLSDMVAEHAARQKNKRKKQQLDSAKPPKKYKEFKF